MKKDKIVTTLKTKEIEKYGFSEIEELKFNKNGIFYCFAYKQIPMTFLKRNGVIYLSVRDDYCKEKIRKFKTTKIVSRKIPYNWWNIYTNNKTVTVINILTGENHQDTIKKFLNIFNMCSKISIGLLMGICEMLLTEFTIARKIYKKDILEKREKYEEKIKESLKKGSEKLGNFLIKFNELFDDIKYDLRFLNSNFNQFYNSIKEIKKKWEYQSENLTDDEFYQFYEELKENNWELDLSSIIHIKY